MFTGIPNFIYCYYTTITDAGDMITVMLCTCNVHNNQGIFINKSVPTALWMGGSYGDYQPGVMRAYLESSRVYSSLSWALVSRSAFILRSKGFAMLAPIFTFSEVVSPYSYKNISILNQVISDVLPVKRWRPNNMGAKAATATTEISISNDLLTFSIYM